MRFLFVGGALCGGGAERQLFQLATALHALGHQVTVATIAQSDLATEFRHVPLRTGSRRNKVGAICGIAGALVRLCRLCMSERPHVLIGWQTVPLILASAVGRYCRTPFVAAIRSSGPEQLSGLYRNELQCALLRMSLRTANFVVANSQSGIDGYSKLRLINSATGTCIIPNGINTNEFQAASNYSIQTARTELGVAHHGPLALYVGRIAVEKDIPLLLRVIDATLAVRPELGWLVVGIERDKLISLAAALGMSVRSDRISFVPRLQQMSLAYHSSDLLCLTSSHEGSPNCVLEARACGIPVISTNCGDVSECMLPNDHIVAADPESFIFALNKVLSPAISARRECAQVLSIAGSATQWLTVLRSVVHGGALPPGDGLILRNSPGPGNQPVEDIIK